MRLLRRLCFVLCLGTAPFALADPPSKGEPGVGGNREEALAEAGKLLGLMNFDTMLMQSIDQLLDLQLEQNPALSPYKQTMRAFFLEYMSYESLEPELLDIYADAFTAAELRDLTRFYETPTGQKAITLMPNLAAKGAMLGSERIQENLPVLERMIAEEAERIEQLQEHAH